MLSSFKNAFNGISLVFRSERNFRIHVFLFAVAIGLGCMVQLSKTDWVVLLLTSMMVFLAESLNTALEKTCDAITPENHPKIKFAKDAAAGAVLITALFALIVGGIVFVPYLT